jgi:hypothetical protein
MVSTIEDTTQNYAGLLIRPDGFIEDVLIPKDDLARFKLYSHVFAGDMIDVLPTNKLTETEVIIGDHSLMNGSPANLAANLWLVSTHRYYGLVCGPVLVVGLDPITEELKDVPPQVWNELPMLRRATLPVLRYLNPNHKAFFHELTT